MILLGALAWAAAGGQRTVAGVLLIAIATIAWAFPFATPSTLATVGIKRSITLVRLGAGALLALAAWVILSHAAIAG